MATQKRCKKCGKLFTPIYNAQRICTRIHYLTCKFCGKEFVPKSDTQRCCSKYCTQKLREQTMVHRYGVTHALKSEVFQEKKSATNIRRFGTPHAAQSDEVKTKLADTFMSKYGVTTPFLMGDFQEKSAKTCLDKYGVQFTSQIPGRIERTKKTNLKKYGAEYPLGNKDIHDKYTADMQRKYGVPYYCMAPECRSLQKHTISQINKDFQVKLLQYGITSFLDSISLQNYSYDVAIEGTSILIELNPTDTHNTYRTPWSNTSHIDSNYHLQKTIAASAARYHCIHIWDWDNQDKIIQQLVLRKERIHARKCKLHILTQNSLQLFESENHLQGGVRGQIVRLGLLYDGQLVQVMSFGLPRYNHNFEWELLRLCSLSGYVVVGGASKLFNYFIQHYSPKSIISYCDRSKFHGEVYTNIGMKLDRTTPPNKVWSQGKHHITNNLLLQRGYDQLFHTSYGKGTSNEELMLQHGWLPVYDCGQAVYVWYSEG